MPERGISDINNYHDDNNYDGDGTVELREGSYPRGNDIGSRRHAGALDKFIKTVEASTGFGARARVSRKSSWLSKNPWERTGRLRETRLIDYARLPSRESSSN